MRIWMMMVALLLATPAWAQQMGFGTKYIGNEAEFAYVWQGRGGAKESLRFRLPLEDLQRGAVEFGDYDQDVVAKEMNAALQQEAARLSSPNFRVAMRPVIGGGLKMEVQGDGRFVTTEKVAEIKAGMEAMQKKIQQDYLYRNWYRTMKDGRIMPDHPRIVKRYAAALMPVVTAIRAQTAGRSQREVIDYVMGWLQTIPYDTLMNRYATVGSGGGVGYQTPYGLILNNKGDCDTKSVALLALVHELYPELPLAMVYVPEHAFAAIGVVQGPQDYALALGNQVLVLADPTGPNLSLLGEIQERAKGFLKNGGGWHLNI